jgi:hypothetical protein
MCGSLGVVEDSRVPVSDVELVRSEPVTDHIESWAGQGSTSSLDSWRVGNMI